MGYKSSVYIKCTKDLEVKLESVLDENGLSGYFGFKKVSEENGFVKFVADELKWNTSYRDIGALANFVQEHKDDCGLLAIDEAGAESANIGNTDKLEMCVVSRIEW